MFGSTQRHRARAICARRPSLARNLRNSGSIRFATRRARRIVVLLAAAAATVFGSSHARAAGGAYVVDTSEVSAEGSCKIESWLSWASNNDFVGVGNPACVVNVGRPVEFSALTFRQRTDEEWTTGIAPKAKTKIVPTAIGSFGLAVSGQAFFDLITHENTALFLNVPATLRLSEVVRINVNGGWLWDRIVDRHYLTYGIGVDWRTPDNVFTFTAEVFGQAGAMQEVSTVTQPRFQTGLRWRPIDRFSIDFIYGRNVYGENANWLTVGTIVRFPPLGGRVGSE